ncbi:MAG TPA: hypothetical protein VHB73_03370 [Alphaproteobacteria bacterium]|nr:hypothetical protein [Alphaproteobacteria bacterium]
MTNRTTQLSTPPLAVVFDTTLVLGRGLESRLNLAIGNFVNSLCEGLQAQKLKNLQELAPDQNALWLTPLAVRDFWQWQAGAEGFHVLPGAHVGSTRTVLELCTVDVRTGFSHLGDIADHWPVHRLLDEDDRRAGLRKDDGLQRLFAPLVEAIAPNGASYRAATVDRLNAAGFHFLVPESKRDFRIYANRGFAADGEVDDAEPEQRQELIASADRLVGHALEGRGGWYLDQALVLLHQAGATLEDVALDRGTTQQELIHSLADVFQRPSASRMRVDHPQP